MCECKMPSCLNVRLRFVGRSNVNRGSAHSCFGASKHVRISRASILADGNHFSALAVTALRIASATVTYHPQGCKATPEGMIQLIWPFGRPSVPPYKCEVTDHGTPPWVSTNKRIRCVLKDVAHCQLVLPLQRLEYI